MFGNFQVSCIGHVRRFKVPCLTQAEPLKRDILWSDSPIGVLRTSPRSEYLWYPDWEIDCVKAFAWPVSPLNYIVSGFWLVQCGAVYHCIPNTKASSLHIHPNRLFLVILTLSLPVSTVVEQRNFPLCASFDCGQNYRNVGITSISNTRWQDTRFYVILRYLMFP
jgi:hypothetical protein